jgi:sec-independent protein translocase protein TatA
LINSQPLVSTYQAEGDIEMIEGLLRPQHIMVILLVAFFIFGGKKLPELGRGMGEGIRGFKDSLKSAGLSKTEEESLKDIEV